MENTKDTKKKQLRLDIDSELHQKFKLKAVKEKKGMYEILAELITKYVK